MKKYNIAIVGATGAVGNEMIKILEQREFPVNEITLLASENSIGKYLDFKGEQIPVNILDENSFRNIDIALFSAGGKISEKFAPIAASKNAVVIDNTSFFRMNPEVPLVIPEVNPEKIEDFDNKGIIANPNCSTIQMLVALKPIHDVAKIKRIVVSTYQSVSGAGLSAMEELSMQSINLFHHENIQAKKFPHRIAYNCIPQIGAFLESGYCEEEIKMIEETKKILGSDVQITATTVRVPVFYGHAESINIETKIKISPSEIKTLYKDFKAVTLIDNPKDNSYPMQIESSGKDEVFVGRIREDKSVDNGIDMWVCADNLRKGAALNAIQIAEILIKEYI
ncbi:MAG: aspartate-semialdehyde dehydrogenase [Pseudomonadota bacterium]